MNKNEYIVNEELIIKTSELNRNKKVNKETQLYLNAEKLKESRNLLMCYTKETIMLREI